MLNSWNCDKKKGHGDEKEAFYVLEGKSRKVSRYVSEDKSKWNPYE
jgi:hypothetical protein